MTHEPVGRLWSSDAWLIAAMTSVESEEKLDPPFHVAIIMESFPGWRVALTIFKFRKPCEFLKVCLQ